MRLESALYASREGLNAQGQAISVVGDNIANSNTVGFKRSRIEFADLLAGGSESSLSGVPQGNIGNGVKVNAVRQIHETGVIEQTDRTLDVGIGGDGFFVVNNGSRDLYTRAGNFTVNSSGLLADSGGNTVLGYGVGGTTLQPINMTSLDAGGKASSAIKLTGNLDASAPEGVPPTAPGSFSDLLTTGAASFSNIVSVYDSLGAAHTVTLTFTKTDTATRSWTAQAWIDGGDVTGGTKGVPQLLGTYAGLSFNTAGGIDAANQAAASLAATNVAYNNGAAAGAFTINLGGFSEYSAASIVNSVTNDGQGTGNIDSYEIGKDGVITAILDSGARKEIGSIALATFPNLDALNRAGDTAFVEGEDAGTILVGRPGEDGFGQLEAGGLERSTVDIAAQFVDLVIFQRAYQASSQTLNAANSLIRDTLGLIR